MRGDSSIAGEKRLVGERKCSDVEILLVAALAATYFTLKCCNVCAQG